MKLFRLALLPAIACFAIACNQTTSAPTSTARHSSGGVPGRTSALVGLDEGVFGGLAAGDVKSGSGDLEFFNLRMDRQTPGGVSIFRQYANPGRDYSFEQGEVIELWAEYRGATNPRFIVNWGDGAVDFINCGSCLMRHAYTRGGRFTVRATLDDRVSTTVTRTFTLSNESSGPLAGSFIVGDGPYWRDHPTSVSCVEACANLFGGSPSSYRCSTVAGTVNGLAFVDGYADEQYCTSPVADTFKLGTDYNCGSAGCSYSAYVLDHGNYPLYAEYGPCGTARNYCFR